MLRPHRLRRLWHSWLRNESPRRPLLRWLGIQKAGLLVVCLLVAFVSSWPWLTEPNLRPGVPAPFDATAPKDALVVDSEALEQRRSNLVPRTFVQVIDRQESQRLRERLERQLNELQQVARSDAAERVGPVNLTPEEQGWLTRQTNASTQRWQNALRDAGNLSLIHI